jgi:hypothetical protein
MHFQVEFVDSKTPPLQIALTLAMMSSDENNQELVDGWDSDQPIFELSGREYE